uniref:Protein kinase domain-containing protein n=1 Tax=Acrobeloides nanus TaxID=290746 RepID=A0A914EEA6_9BILA
MNGEIQPSGDAIDFRQNSSHLPVRPRDVIIKTNEKFSDSYDLYEILGRGCFGKVYLCKEKSTQLNLAAKYIRLTRDSDRKKVEKEVMFFALKGLYDWPFTR